MNKFFILTLGCSKNEVDSESIVYSLEAKGLEKSDTPEDADYLIVNTCGFINSAKEESINNILELAELKKYGSDKKLIVTGCFSQISSGDLKLELPEVDSFFGVGQFKALADSVDSSGVFIKSPEEAEINPGRKGVPSVSAYIKIAEGCDNNCSYCVIPKIRGSYRSRSIDDIVSEAKSMVNDSGVKELNIISQDSAVYRDSDDPSLRLESLLGRLEEIDGLEWIRVLYLHPAHLSDSLIDKITSSKKVCSYFDIPVQHLSDTVLDGMKRRVNFKRIDELVRRIRGKSSDNVIRTSIILGFPGETEDDFALLIDRIKQIEFDKLGCFTYSRESGAEASEFNNQVSQDIKESRLEKVMLLQSEISEKRMRRFIGKTLSVLIEEKVEGESDLYLGRSRYDAPDVDGVVVVNAGNNKILPGSIERVRIEKTMQYDLYGVLL